MPDQNTLEDRLGAVVDRIRQTILDAPRFRPSDAALAADYDKQTASLLQSLVEISAAAAVDRASIMVAADLAQQRKDHALAMQKQRDESDAAMRERAIPFLPASRPSGVA